MNKEKITKLITELLREIGEDPTREGLVDTPLRVAKMYEKIMSGYTSNIDKVINNAIFSQETNNMIVVKDIELYSMCEHHMLPFTGRCHIGYISQGKVLGVSKLARIVEHFARRLQIQENLTNQIAVAIKDIVNAEGVGVVIEAQHLCMMMRGVEKQNSVMVTSSVLGSFRDEAVTRQEFMALIKK